MLWHFPLATWYNVFCQAISLPLREAPQADSALTNILLGFNALAYFASSSWMQKKSYETMSTGLNFKYFFFVTWTNTLAYLASSSVITRLLSDN
jgi:hypothetical protein